MLVGKDHMLLGKDHAGGEESCVGGKYHHGGKGSCGWWKMLIIANSEFSHEKYRFLHKTGPHVSVRNINCSKLSNFSPPT